MIPLSLDTGKTPDRFLFPCKGSANTSFKQETQQVKRRQCTSPFVVEPRSAPSRSHANHHPLRSFNSYIYRTCWLLLLRVWSSNTGNSNSIIASQARTHCMSHSPRRLFAHLPITIQHLLRYAKLSLERRVICHQPSHEILRTLSHISNRASKQSSRQRLHDSKRLPTLLKISTYYTSQRLLINTKNIIS